MNLNNIRTISIRTISLAVMTALCMATVVSAPAIAAPSSQPEQDSLHPQVSIATRLTEVHRGTLDGRDYLTLHIGGHAVGPSSCRSNVLRMDTSSDSGAERQEEIETIALSAMLTDETVMIVVPLDTAQCVDGKPTITDLYLLPASP